MGPSPPLRLTAPFLVAVVLFLSACGFVTPAPATSPSIEFIKAIEFRQSAGLRSDELWVRTVEGDRTAVERYGVLVTRAEAAELDARLRAQHEVGPAIVAYAESQPESGGVFVESKTGTFIVSFTGDLERHREAILRLFAPGAATIEVRQVRWSTAELDANLVRIMSPAGQTWLEQRGATFRGLGSRVQENNVRLELAVPAPDPALVDDVVRRFAGVGWLDVVVDVEPALALPFGSLELRVVDDREEPLVEVICWLHSAVRGAGGDIHDTDPTGTCAWERLHATQYRVETRTSIEGAVIAETTVTVLPHQTTRKTVIAKRP